jgi:hypothetical protein
VFLENSLEPEAMCIIKKLLLVVFNVILILIIPVISLSVYSHISMAFIEPSDEDMVGWGVYGPAYFLQTIAGIFIYGFILFKQKFSVYWNLLASGLIYCLILIFILSGNGWAFSHINLYINDAFSFFFALGVSYMTHTLLFSILIWFDLRQKPGS